MIESFRPWYRARTISSVSPEFLARWGLTAAALDMDNTVVEWHSSDVPPGIRSWIEQMRKAGLRMCIVSNTHRPGRLRRLATELGIGWVPQGGKPSTRGYRQALAQMQASPGETVAIGDQLLTDVLGGNRAGLRTILVDPMSTHEFIGTRLVSRTIERALLRRLESQAPLAYLEDDAGLETGGKP